MQLVLKPEYQLGLTAQELRLVSLALSGRLPFDEHPEDKDVVAAKELGTRIFTQRASQTLEYAKTVQPKAQGGTDE